MPTDSTTEPQVVGRIDDWRRRLIDLSARNRLVAYKPTQATTLTIAAPSLHELLAEPRRETPWDFYFPPEPEVSGDDEAESGAATTVDDALIRASASERQRRPNEIEVSEQNPRRIARILDNLAKRSNTEFQDKALRILYVAAGFLDWHDEQRGKDVTSPLVLVPVELRRENARAPYRLFFVDDEDIVINPSLTEKLRRDVGLDVPADWAWEDKPIGQELDEIREAVQATGWTVREQAVIGLFSFQKYVMYRDLLDHEDRVASHPLVRSLAHGRLVDDALSDVELPDLADLDDAQPPERALSILDADASQRQCIEAAKRGQSFVMQGPPGTGKSQTIANVIAELIGRGKRILFVSEKAAALDVVYRRLQWSGLDEYCLMLHGEHAARREVVQALDRSLTSALQPRSGMRKKDLERLTHLATALNDSARLLHLPMPALGDYSIREVNELLAELHFAPSVPGAPAASDVLGQEVQHEYQALREVFERLAERWAVSAPSFVWRGYAATEFSAADRGMVGHAVDQLGSALRDLDGAASQVAHGLGLPRPLSQAAARELDRVSRHLEEAPVLPADWLAADANLLFARMSEAREAFATRHSTLAAVAEIFPARDLSDLPTSVGEHVRQAADAVQRACGLAPAWEHSPSTTDALRAALEALPDSIAQVRDEHAGLASLLGEDPQSTSQRDLDQLVALAKLSFTAEERPIQQWLVDTGSGAAQAVFDDLSSDLREYQGLYRELESHYGDRVLDLDAAPMVERFEKQYTSFFSRFSAEYRADARAIKDVRLDGKLPAVVVDDLKQVARLRELGVRLDAKDAVMRQHFGPYAEGRQTNLEKVAAALSTARRAAELRSVGADLGALAGRICLGSSPDPSLIQSAERLEASKQRLIKLFPAIQTFVLEPGTLWAETLDGFSRDVDLFRAPLLELLKRFDDLNLGSARRVETLEDLQARAALVDAAHRARQVVNDGDHRWAAELGTRYQGEATEWSALEADLSWLVSLRSQLSETSAPLEKGLTSVGQRWPSFSELHQAADRCEEATQRVTGLYEPTRQPEVGVLLEGRDFGAAGAACEALATHIDELLDWTEWKTWLARADDRGWGVFARALAELPAVEDDVRPAFERAFWSGRLEAAFKDDPDIGEDLRGGAFQRWVEEFSTLDRQLVQSGVDRVISRREALRTNHLDSPGSEVQLLRREARKKTRHLPVRVLLSKIPKLLSELKPCLMMSPLTVSHFLAADHTFDVVIFDEASQVPPQDAVNCVYRGKQLIVAGDAKQLPPTPFFQIAELDELSPEEEETSTQEDMESVLDACEALLIAHPLRWHYRSRSEPLIGFSNDQMYDGSLVTFPSAEELSAGKGVSLTYVPDGVYDRGKTASNRREAQVVAKRVAEYLKDGTRRSVGVIAFNSKQAQAIAEELDLLRLQDPELDQRFAGDRLDAVFVKHLEAVQGDERDVILLSVGYGPDANGKFTMNFGPLNKDGGQRRLNVAITRARERLEVVSSVRASDFSIGEGSSRGAAMLRDYLAYAEAGGTLEGLGGREEAQDAGGWSTPLEREIAAAIEDLGYLPVPAVGIGSFRIDIGVRATGVGHRYVLGIECDGASWASTPTARDRERLRHEVLDQLGWGPIHRIWSVDWVRNRHGELERLRTALIVAEERAKSAPAPLAEVPSPRPEAPARVERTVIDLAEDGTALEFPWVEHYVVSELPTMRPRLEFHDSVDRGRQTDTLVDLINTEAPVSIDYAMRRVAEAWGISRLGNRVVGALRESITKAGKRGSLEVRGDYLWRPGQSIETVRVPDPDVPESRRDVEDIPPEERKIALRELRRASPGIDEDALIVQAARLFGFRHTGAQIRGAFESLIDELDA